ncbi:hypothetical protein OG875_18480 [Streptomyces sp. NBC_01498]|nr:hypothetical protein [Streptomyces sp. NBC_01498]WTL26396.1 hypothetical protein OG875_18480 [Streptomyces sp. NBC_01498]
MTQPVPTEVHAWEEREINRIVDERVANPAVGVPIEGVMRETPARGE